LPLLADVASPEEMGRAVDRLAGAYGRLDIAVANAGINGVWAPIDELAPEEWDRTIAVNLRGTFLTLMSSASPSALHASSGCGEGRARRGSAPRCASSRDPPICCKGRRGPSGSTASPLSRGCDIR